MWKKAINKITISNSSLCYLTRPLISIKCSRCYTIYYFALTDSMPFDGVLGESTCSYRYWYLHQNKLIFEIYLLVDLKDRNTKTSHQQENWDLPSIGQHLGLQLFLLLLLSQSKVKNYVLEGWIKHRVYRITSSFS